jgi:hypothetical protein
MILLLTFFVTKGTKNEQLVYNPKPGLSLANSDGKIVGHKYKFKDNWEFETISSDDPMVLCEVALSYSVEKGKKFYLVKYNEHKKGDFIKPKDFVYYVDYENPLVLTTIKVPRFGVGSEMLLAEFCELNFNSTDQEEIKKFISENQNLFENEDISEHGHGLNTLQMVYVDEKDFPEGQNFSYNWIKGALKNDDTLKNKFENDTRSFVDTKVSDEDFKNNINKIVTSNMRNLKMRNMLYFEMNIERTVLSMAGGAVAMDAIDTMSEENESSEYVEELSEDDYESSPIEDSEEEEEETPESIITPKTKTNALIDHEEHSGSLNSEDHYSETGQRTIASEDESDSHSENSNVESFKDDMESTETSNMTSDKSPVESKQSSEINLDVSDNHSENNNLSKHSNDTLDSDESPNVNAQNESTKEYNDVEEMSVDKSKSLKTSKISMDDQSQPKLPPKITDNQSEPFEENNSSYVSIRSFNNDSQNTWRILDNTTISFHAARTSDFNQKTESNRILDEDTDLDQALKKDTEDMDETEMTLPENIQPMKNGSSDLNNLKRDKISEDDQIETTEELNMANQSQEKSENSEMDIDSISSKNSQKIERENESPTRSHVSELDEKESVEVLSEVFDEVIENQQHEIELAWMRGVTKSNKITTEEREKELEKLDPKYRRFLDFMTDEVDEFMLKNKEEYMDNMLSEDKLVILRTNLETTGSLLLQDFKNLHNGQETKMNLLAYLTQTGVDSHNMFFDDSVHLKLVVRYGLILFIYEKMETYVDDLLESQDDFQTLSDFLFERLVAKYEELTQEDLKRNALEDPKVWEDESTKFDMEKMFYLLKAGMDAYLGKGLIEHIFAISYDEAFKGIVGETIDILTENQVYKDYELIGKGDDDEYWFDFGKMCKLLTYNNDLESPMFTDLIDIPVFTFKEMRRMLV